MKDFDKRKFQKLKETMETYAAQDVCVAFSGGVDSALVLKLACEAAKKSGARVYAVTMDTKLHPASDLKIAAAAAKETGAVHVVLKLDEFSIPGIKNNPVNRCYLCKKAFFKEILGFAAEKKISRVLEGSNEDDLHVYRPGLQAIKELGIKSPLADCGITKKEVRLLAGNLGISAADRPSAPCLATRLPYGAEIDTALLKRIAAGEDCLRSLGFGNVRIRVHRDILRLELDISDFERLYPCREAVLQELQQVGCTYVTLDLQGFRSGSMDVTLKEHKI